MPVNDIWRIPPKEYLILASEEKEHVSRHYAKPVWQLYDFHYNAQSFRVPQQKVYQILPQSFQREYRQFEESELWKEVHK